MLIVDTATIIDEVVAITGTILFFLYSLALNNSSVNFQHFDFNRFISIPSAFGIVPIVGSLPS